MNGGGWRLALRRALEGIGPRLVLFSAAAIAISLVAGYAGALLPARVDIDLGQDAVQPLLQILATSMLAVTTFSLTAMISAYSSAAARTTPRATQLLLRDPTSHNALGAFLGAFVFSVVGLAALSTEYYDERGRVVLYVGAIAVIAVVVVTLLRWIHHLTGFGRMADVIDRVESAALDTVIAHAHRPHLGGSPATPIPASARQVAAESGGMVTAIDVRALDGIAEREGLIVHVVVTPGSAIGVGEAVARIDGAVDDSASSAICRAFLIEHHRTFEQDPRLGLVALAEIASRALSPAVNDPGTAIEALGAIQRVLTAHLTASPDGEVAHPRVHVPSVTLDDLVEDALRPIARDGATSIEVGLRIQRVLRALLVVAPPESAGVLREASLRAQRRADQALTHEGDRELLDHAANRTRGASA